MNSICIYYSVTITRFKLPVRTRSSCEYQSQRLRSQVENLGSDIKKTLSQPASQNTVDRDATKVGDAYPQGKCLTYKR